jgi:CHASE2 domain-containing sensor protein
MSPHERLVFVRSLAIGVILTTFVLGVGKLGWLDALENWTYDEKAIHCQLSEPPPTDRLIHLDIDDAALDAIGRWPWPRAALARLLEEIERCQPSALGLDILLSDAQAPRLVQDSAGALHTIDDDAELTKVLQKNGNAVLAMSFQLETGELQTPQMVSAVKWFTDDLELSRTDFGSKVAASGWTKLSDAEIDDLFLGARRQAMKNRIDRELDLGPVNPEALLPRLLPQTDVSVGSPLSRLFQQEYAASETEHAIYRFGAPSQTLMISPVQGRFNSLPELGFSNVAASCAFTNYDIFDTATVRSVPLFVECDHRLYPQMGLAVACVMLGADPTKVRFEGSTVVIPSPGGAISIPTHLYHSRTLGRDVPLIASIPWFGTRAWETMYDWPKHNTAAAHISLARVWDICGALDKIARNNASVDEAISQILSNDRPDKLSLDPDLAKKYATKLPDPQDIETREKMAQLTLKTLKDSTWLDMYHQLPESQLTTVEKFQRDKIYDANNALLKLIPQNRDLRAQVNSQRSWLVSQINGKGVLIGYMATGLRDTVTTSLHLRCPGVVVHGAVANALLMSRWWHVAPDWVTFLLTLLFGVLTAAALGWFTPVFGSLTALALLIGYLLFNALVLFGWQRWVVGMAAPSMVIILVWAGCTVYRVILEAIERNRIAMEVAVINREMDLARQVQVALIPAAAPKTEGLEADGWAQTASVTGGDCYDMWHLPDGRLAVLLADASGHGLAPAMVVSELRTLVRALCEFESHPHGLLTRVNSRMAEDLESSRFVTVFLGFISPKGQVDWASAGQGPIYWRPDDGGELKELDSTGLPMGIEVDWIADAPPEPLQLGKSGMIIIFSDGIFEARAPNGEMFGVERVKDIISSTHGPCCTEVLSRLRCAVQAFQGRIEPIDDQTIVVVQRADGNQAAL